MIIYRYLSKDIFKVWLSVLVILLIIATSNRFVRLIAQAATGDLSPALLFQMVGLQIPEMMAFMMPLALFLAILFTFSRYSVDQEFTALLALGFSWKRLVGLCLALSVVVMFLTASITFWIAPHLAHIKEKLLTQEGPAVLLQTLTKGRFYSFQNDRLVFYVENISEDKKHLQEVFIAQQPNGEEGAQPHWTVVTALEGKISEMKKGQTFVELTQGHRFEGKPGNQDYVMIDFDAYGRLIEKREPKEGLYAYRSMPTKMLFETQNPSLKAELQWRLAQPLSALILALLALPLGRVPPRKGMYNSLFPAVVLFIVYFNLLSISKRWIAQGVLSETIGMWWVHGLMLIVALCVLAHASGKMEQMFFKMKSKIYA